MTSRTTGIFKLVSRRTLAATGVAALLLAGTASGIRASHPAGPLLVTPHHGGSIAIRTIGEDTCLNGELTGSNVAAQIDVGLTDPLVTADQKGKLSPDLATSWKISNGGKKITFFLRHGVRFSNGDPFDASSVKWNYEHVLNPKTKSPDAFALGPLKTVKVLNKYTVQLVMKAVFRPLFTALQSYYFGMVDPRTTAKLGNKECLSLVGTGPFKLKSVGPAFNPIVMVRNPYHTWASPWQFNHGQAYLDQITFKPILSDSTAISELLTGGVQVSEVAPTQLNRVKGNRNIVIRKYPEEGLYYLTFNYKHAPLDNPTVRRALAEAIDRNAIIRVAAAGLGRPAYSLIPSNIPDSDPQSKNYAPAYNPADAQKLLKGIKLPTLTLLSFNDPTATAIDELIQAELAQVGVNVNVQAHAIADSAALASQGQYDIDLTYVTYDDPDLMYLVLEPGPTYSPWPSSMTGVLAQLTRYLTNGRQSNNPAFVRRNYIAAQRLVNNLTLTDPLYSALDIFGINKSVHGWHANFFTLGYTVAPVLQDLWVGK